MPKVADKQEMDPAELSPEAQPALGEKKDAAPQEKDKGKEAAEAAPAGAQQDEAAAEKQVQPHIRIAQPTSGDAYPLNTKLPIVLECEGTGKFDAQLRLKDSKGFSRAEMNVPVDLGAENKGHTEVVIDLEATLKAEGGADQSGTYQLHAFGSDGSGQMAPMSRINIDIIDEAASYTPNMPKDVANAPADDKPE
jgi:hypothetical protein